MTEILHSPSHFPPSSSPSPSSSNSLTCARSPPLSCAPHHGEVEGNECDPEEEGREERRRDEQEEAQLSLLALLVALFRKSLAACKNTDRRELCAMEIGWPTNVRHVAHVTFDRFNGFLGLPVASCFFWVSFRRGVCRDCLVGFGRAGVWVCITG
ncbi:hypothetical protein Tsubulata_020136 [Turnera subulata]|uniref:CRIB domain-containing protein n=1 Tax=Turnera subulata TaxID=218843 RepID=A0A9Q0G2F7_9ROSI|nr:hypothetical protein Tsubulata_020136 [Turnera subulata]